MEDGPVNQQPASQADSAQPPPQPELIDISYFGKIEFRVARIEACEPVPKSKRLLKLSINLGEKLGKRQILAGIAQFYGADSLVGRKIVVVANLKPAVLMGHESRGMLLAASSSDGTKLQIVDPGQDMELGAQVR